MIPEVRPVMLPDGRGGSMAKQRERRKQRAQKGVHAAPFWQRSIAFTLDFTLLIALAVLAGVFFQQLDLSRIPPDPRWNVLDQIVDVLLDQAGGLRFVGVMVLGLGAIGGGLCDASWGGTPGKRLLGMRVVDRFGETPGTLRALLRNGFKMLLLAPMGLGGWWAAFDGNRRALHDRLTGSWVVRASHKRGWSDD